MWVIQSTRDLEAYWTGYEEWGFFAQAITFDSEHSALEYAYNVLNFEMGEFTVECIIASEEFDE